jgi:hypothetical protein
MQCRKYYKLFLEQKTALDEARILQRLTPQLRQEALVTCSVSRDHS